MYGYCGAMFHLCVCVVCILFPLVAPAREKVLDNDSCRRAKEVYVKHVGPADDVPVSPISDASLNECSSTLKHTHSASCCNSNMESKFLLASADYIRQHIQMSNTNLKARITQSLNLYQEHLRLSMQEAHNKTADTLATLYKIPKEIHSRTLDAFFQQLNRYLLGSNELSLTDIIDNFFVNLFPSVFDYVLSDPSKPKTGHSGFHTCLIEHYKDIQPFGNAPKHLGTKIKYAFRRARIFTETLQVMISTIGSTDNIAVDKECRKAITRLEFCSLCTGELEAKPCRGMCLNVMRGCLAGVSEISSSWDELVVAFENLHLGMFKQNNAQELLSYLDGNVTDALLQAMDDGPIIYSRVTSLCRESNQSEGETALFRKVFTPESQQVSHPSSRIHSIRKDITSLITQLEDSKGFLQRIADGLCRKAVDYDQEMQSDKCWNGSAVGRYMHAVPEANMISQAQHNMEVRITLIPDTNLLQVKDTLTHMRRNLSILHNEELMLSDETYKTVVGSGGGYSTQGRDTTIDDEDLAAGVSGSGSGDYDEEEPVYEEKSTAPVRPTDDTGRSQISTGSVSPKPGLRDPKSQDKPATRGGPKGSSADSLVVSITVVLLCTVLSKLQL
ncbi:hypothetical protein BsWGS_03754 [Bradybaena similaris]